MGKEAEYIARISYGKDSLKMLEVIRSRGLPDVSQGFDARLLTPENIEAIKRIRIKNIHFAWDLMKFTDAILDGLDLWREFGSKDRHGSWGTVYVLVNFNTTMKENLFRIYELRAMGFNPYVMVYDKPRAPHEIRRLQRWCNNKRIFKKCPTFEEYYG